MSNRTHQTRIARHLSGELSLPYQLVLEHVRAAAADQVLPIRLDDVGRAAAEAVVADRIRRAPAFTRTPSPTIWSEYASHPEVLTFGYSDLGTALQLTTDELTGFCQVVGPSRTDRHQALRTIADGLLAAGWAGTLVSFSDDAGPEGLRAWARSTTASTAYQELALTDSPDSSWVDPLVGLSPEQARNVVLSVLPSTDALTRERTSYLLELVLTLMEEAHRVHPSTCDGPNLFGLTELCGGIDGPDSIHTYLQVLVNEGVPLSHFRALAEPTDAQAGLLSILGDTLAHLFLSASGRTVLPPTAVGSGRQLELYAEGLTYVNLSSPKNKTVAQLVSAGVLTQYALRSHSDRRRFLLVDGANLIIPQALGDVLEEAGQPGLESVWWACSDVSKWPNDDSLSWDTLAGRSQVSLLLRQTTGAAMEQLAYSYGPYRSADGEKLPRNWSTELSSYTSEELLVLTAGPTARSVHGYLATPARAHALEENLTQLGDAEGIRIGAAVQTQRPVLIDPSAAARANLPTVMAVLGDPGTGKTAVCQAIVRQMLDSGRPAVVVDVDGGTQLGSWSYWAKHAGLSPRFLRLSDAMSDPGLFDPFRFCEPTLAAQILTNHIQTILPRLSEREHSSLRDGLECASHSGAQCAGEALSYVQDPNLVELVQRLAVSSSLFSSGFSSQPGERWHPTPGLTIITVDQKVQLPPLGKYPSTYTPSERESLAVVRLMMRAGVELLVAGRSGVLVNEESHYVFGSEAGRYIRDRVAHAGRSDAIFPIFTAIADAHLDYQELETWISRFLLLRTAAPERASLALNLAGLKPNMTYLRLLRNINKVEGTNSTGIFRGLFRDLNQNHGIIELDKLTV